MYSWLGLSKNSPKNKKIHKPITKFIIEKKAIILEIYIYRLIGLSWCQIFSPSKSREILIISNIQPEHTHQCAICKVVVASSWKCDFRSPIHYWPMLLLYHMTPKLYYYATKLQVIQIKSNRIDKYCA